MRPRSRIFSGDSGIRTRVHTRNRYAFYTLILVSIFEQKQDPSHQLLPYLLKTSPLYRSLQRLSLLFPHRFTLSAARLGLERCPVSAPCAEMTLTYCTSVKQREHNLRCQLIVWTRLTCVIHARRAYVPFLLAVKTSYPLVFFKRACKSTRFF